MSTAQPFCSFTQRVNVFPDDITEIVVAGLIRYFFSFSPIYAAYVRLAKIRESLI